MKKFKPKSGQIDFTHARWAPVINCVLKYQNKILIVKRSDDLPFYPGLWNNIAGFLDDKKSLEEKVREEIKEETGISARDIVSIKLGKIFDEDEPRYKKTWIVHPVLVKLRTNKVKTNWEAQEYKWVTLKEIKKFKTMPGFSRVIKDLF